MIHFIFYLCYRVTVTFYKPFAMAELSSTYTLPLKRKFILPFRLILVNKPLQGMAPTECPFSACLPACLLAYLPLDPSCALSRAPS